MHFGVLRHFPVVAAIAACLAAAPALAEDPSFALIIKDHKFEPTELVVPAGAKIRLVVKNQDSTPEEFESSSLKREKVIPGGKEAVITIGPLKQGSYEFWGDFNKQSARGKLVAQ
jgi:hypothetical protein